jgi:fumarylacetoacetate (FAA) hydrolase
MYQGSSDCFLGPRDPISFDSESYGIDMEAEVAVILGDVPMGANLEQALAAIRLIVLLNDVSLRELVPAELAKGFGFVQSKPASAASPVAITPNELGSAWRDGKVCLPIITTLNDKVIGRPDAGKEMQFNFPQLIVHAAKTRPLRAGTILGSGTVSNSDIESGVSCLAEQRMLEIIENGKPTTPFMRFGDRVKIEMLDEEGRSIFGVIDQSVEQYKKPVTR